MSATGWGSESDDAEELHDDDAPEHEQKAEACSFWPNFAERRMQNH